MASKSDFFKKFLNRVAKNLSIGEAINNPPIVDGSPTQFVGSRPNSFLDVGRPSEDIRYPGDPCCEIGCCAIKYALFKIVNWSSIKDAVLSAIGGSQVLVKSQTQGQMAFFPKSVVMFSERKACLSTTKEGCEKIQKIFTPESSDKRTLAAKPNPICLEQVAVIGTGFKKGKCEQVGCVPGYTATQNPIKLSFLAEGSTEAVDMTPDSFVNPNTYNAIKMAMVGGCMSQTFEQLTNITEALAQEQAYADAVDVTAYGALALLIGGGLIATRSAAGGACQSFRLAGLAEFGAGIDTIMYGTNYKLVFKELLKLVYGGIIAGEFVDGTLASILSSEIMRAKIESMNPTSTILEPKEGICYGESPVIDISSPDDLSITRLPWEEYINESQSNE